MPSSSSSPPSPLSSYPLLPLRFSPLLSPFSPLPSTSSPPPHASPLLPSPLSPPPLLLSPLLLSLLSSPLSSPSSPPLSPPLSPLPSLLPLSSSPLTSSPSPPPPLLPLSPPLPSPPPPLLSSPSLLPLSSSLLPLSPPLSPLSSPLLLSPPLSSSPLPSPPLPSLLLLSSSPLSPPPLLPLSSSPLSPPPSPPSPPPLLLSPPLSSSPLAPPPLPSLLPSPPLPSLLPLSSSPLTSSPSPPLPLSSPSRPPPLLPLSSPPPLSSPSLLPSPLSPPPLLPLSSPPPLSSPSPPLPLSSPSRPPPLLPLSSPPPLSSPSLLPSPLSPPPLLPLSSPPPLLLSPLLLSPLLLSLLSSPLSSPSSPPLSPPLSPLPSLLPLSSSPLTSSPSPPPPLLPLSSPSLLLSPHLLPLSSPPPLSSPSPPLSSPSLLPSPLSPPLSSSPLPSPPLPSPLLLSPLSSSPPLLLSPLSSSSPPTLLLSPLSSPLSPLSSSPLPSPRLPSLLPLSPLSSPLLLSPLSSPSPPLPSPPPPLLLSPSPPPLVLPLSSPSPLLPLSPPPLSSPLPSLLPLSSPSPLLPLSPPPLLLSPSPPPLVLPLSSPPPLSSPLPSLLPLSSPSPLLPLSSSPPSPLLPLSSSPLSPLSSSSLLPSPPSPPPLLPSPAMRETKEALESIGSSLDTLQEGTVRLQLSLSNERASLSNTLSDPACTNGAVSHTCNTIRSTLGQLGSSADFSTLPDVSRQLMNVDALLKTDLSNIIQKGYSSFNDTPRLVKEQTKNIVAGVKVMLDRIGGEIVDFAKMFPVEASLANFTIFLNQGQQQIESYYAQIDQLDFYRWIGCVAALCMVVLIVCFNLLGLLCGSCGYDKQATPTNRGCLSNTGGNLLMAGVGFSFLFAWALMAVVSSLFVVGGNVEKLICEPLANRQLFQIIDTPYIMHPGMKNFLPNMLFQNPNIDLTVGGMYRECHENYGLYHALQLETMFNINSFLNRTVYNKDLANVFESIHVQLQDVSLLEQEGRDALISFANSGVGEIDFTAYLTEANKAVTLVDLLSFATDLEAQADQLPRGALENALKGHASSIRQINKDQVVPLQQAMNSLSQSVRLLQKTVSDLPVQVTNVLSAIDAAEYLITNNASHVIKQETNGYMQMLVGYFRQYTKWVKSSLSAEVAQCKPISNIVDSMEIVGCSFIVDSVNTFWFGLGGCLVLLIPSIILSVKLSKYYRRMDTEDVFDDACFPWLVSL
uniref:Prominin 1 b n=1 Tax=Gadus morhua TaxID=8049 RepID=A0A8C5CIC1_GADMO